MEASVQPCCKQMAELVDSETLGVKAYLSHASPPPLSHTSRAHLYFRAVEVGNERDLESILRETPIEFLTWCRVNINFCPFCGYDWRK